MKRHFRREVLERYWRLFGTGVCLGILTALIINSGIQANTPIEYARAYEEVEPKVVQIGTQIDWTPERIALEIEKQAKAYNVNADEMKRVIQCESMGSTTIQSYHQLSYGREQSFGLAQIHLPDHPNVTKEQAIDPVFAIEFMAKHFAQGRQEMWHCY